MTITQNKALEHQVKEITENQKQLQKSMDDKINKILSQQLRIENSLEQVRSDHDEIKMMI